MERPDREEVYASWLDVQQLEIKLRDAKAKHQKLADARYHAKPEYMDDLPKDRDALGAIVKT